MPLNPFIEVEDGVPVDEIRPVPDYVNMVRGRGEYSRDRKRFELEVAMQRLNRQDRKLMEDLKRLTDRTGMPILQENGQRRYGPPLSFENVIPPKGCEVFVGKIPRDCFEPELVPVFERAGQIFELRLMMDFSGTNRGYCFVHYFTPEEARRAVETLHNYPIRPGRKIGVVMSVDNCRLFLGDIPGDKTALEIQEEVKKWTNDVVRVFVRPNYKTKEKNLGFAFVEFKCHRAAAMARRKLTASGKVTLWGKEVNVDWADPQDEDLAPKPKPRFKDSTSPATEIETRHDKGNVEFTTNYRQRGNGKWTEKPKRNDGRCIETEARNLQIGFPALPWKDFGNNGNHFVVPYDGLNVGGRTVADAQTGIFNGYNMGSVQGYSQFYGQYRIDYPIPGVPSQLYMAQWAGFQYTQQNEFVQDKSQSYEASLSWANFGAGVV